MPEAHCICSLVQTNSRSDGVDEDVVVVATSLVGTESSELVLKNELALVVERRSVVVADIDLTLGIVKNRLFKLVLYPCISQVHDLLSDCSYPKQKQYQRQGFPWYRGSELL